MSGTGYPEVVQRQTGGQRQSNIQLASPPLSPDSAVRPSERDLLKRYSKSAKSVHWDKDVIDNEYKRRMMPPSPLPSPPGIRTPFTYSSGDSQTHLAPNFPGANSSVRVSSSTAKSLGSKARSYPSSSRSPIYSNGRVMETQVANTSSRREPDAYGQRQMTAQAYYSSGYTPNFDREVAVAPQPASYRLPTIGFRGFRPVSVSNIPPVVPDAPPRQGPPPTPRPARLPTPDLPEICESEFCDCYRMAYSKAPRRTERPVYVKMNAQLEAARGYMKN